MWQSGYALLNRLKSLVRAQNRFFCTYFGVPLLIGVWFPVAWSLTIVASSSDQPLLLPPPVAAVVLRKRVGSEHAIKNLNDELCLVSVRLVIYVSSKQICLFILCTKSLKKKVKLLFFMAITNEFHLIDRLEFVSRAFWSRQFGLPTLRLTHRLRLMHNSEKSPVAGGVVCVWLTSCCTDES